MLEGQKRKNKKKSKKAVIPVTSVTGGGFVIQYGQRKLNINPLIYNEIMKLQRASEEEIDQVYIREKKRLAKLLLPDDSYNDMIWLLCRRIGL